MSNILDQIQVELLDLVNNSGVYNLIMRTPFPQFWGLALNLILKNMHKCLFPSWKKQLLI